MSVVVTGGARGVGRAVAERLAEHGTVVVVDLDEEALAWTEGVERITAVVGSAADPAVAERAADTAGALTGWVNNAAVFRDASPHTAPPETILELIELNLAPAVVGSAAAVRRFLAAGTGGAIVNMSSHQAQRPVPGCVPYATAKAAIEGLTRAMAAEYGPDGIRVNAVALGSVRTGRHDDLLAAEPGRAGEITRRMRDLHALGRMGLPGEAAEAVAFLLSERAGFITGVTLPVDGGRAILAQDPESARE
ncbi:SDR family oxidoreductase [Actinocorallia longicatena]|uniref:SDR family oxidoreductase n=1 Tax=Actinocorallia longicatena TaxID=111803 RepID=A0ABP6Q3J2_9ACTN